MSRSRGFTDVPIRLSAALGFAAYFVGYAVTLLFIRGRITTLLSRATVSDGYLSSKALVEVIPFKPPLWATAGWVFYNAQLTAIQVPRPMGPGGVPGGQMMKSGTLVQPLQSAGGIFLLAFAIPAVVVTATGLLAVYYTRPDTFRGSVYTGAAVFLGYAPLATVGAFVFTLPTGNGLVTPDLLAAVCVTGFAYPFALGGLGGWFGYLLLGRIETGDGSEPVSRAFEDNAEIDG